MRCTVQLRRLLAPALAVLGCVAAAPAGAATISLQGTAPNATIVIGGDDDLSTSVVIRQLDADTIRISDQSTPGHDLAAGPGCTLGVKRRLVDCPADGVAGVDADMGTGDDGVDAQGFPLPVDLEGGPGDDRLTGGTGADRIDGGDDNDQVWMTVGGPDDVTGGAGFDKVTFLTAGTTTITLDDQPGDGPGGRMDNVHSDFEEVDGGPGADTIVGTDGPDVLDGGNGKDHLEGMGGDDVLEDGPATTCDTDQLDGGPGNDTLMTDNGQDVVNGDEGDDELDVGDSHFCPTKGGARLSGGDGTDTVSYRWAGAPVTVTLDGVPNDGVGQIDYVAPDVENAIGSSYDDVLVGNSGDNVLDGGPGDDVLDGGLGADVLRGGDGEDVVDYSTRSAPLSVDLDGETGDDGEAGEGDTVGTDVEGIWGGSGNDHLTGGPGNDIIDGGSGADVMAGGPGFDVIDYSLRGTEVTFNADGVYGDSGQFTEHDTVMPDVEGVIGGAAPDTLNGNAQDNYLEGGPGDDQIDGRGGSDLLVGDDGDDTIVSRDDATDEVLVRGRGRRHGPGGRAGRHRLGLRARRRPRLR